MAENDRHLSDEIDVFPVDDDHWIELELDNSIKIQLRKIQNDFESIFSWNIHKLSEFNHNLKFNIIGKVQEKQEMIMDIDNTDNQFIFYRFFLQLITIHEDYMCKRYKKSYLGIESIVKFLETCTFDKSDKQFSDAYHHIARSTNVYIALTLKIDSEKLLNDIKQIKNFNCAEKAAICAVKARIFMEYPPKGNDIALEFAYQARNLHSTEPEWLLIWLKAKKRVRHRYEPYKSPGVDEIRAAELLCKMAKMTPYPKFLIHAYQLYKEAGFIHKMNNNLQRSNEFYKLSSDIAKKSIELAKYDKKHMDSILLHYIHFPKYLVSKDFIDNIIKKLTSVKNSIVHLTIGRYYLCEKNYEKAKIYFTRGEEYGNFNSSLQLIKVECLLEKSDQKFDYVQKLKEMYKVYQNPKNRIIILTHILIYYNYCDYNPKDMMDYLKLYIDQDIEDAIKKRQLMYVRPLFNDDRSFIKANEFLNVLSVNIKELMNNNNWDKEEKNTFDQFNKILKLNIDDNRFNNSNKTAVSKENESWRKQRVDMSENKYIDSHPQNKESWRKQQNSRHEFGSHLSNELHKKCA